MCGVLCGQVAGLESIQFRNWNCSSIPIPILELELELKLVELKMELELKILELELELNFLQLLPQHLLVNQQFPKVWFDRGHNLPCDWFLVQQGCFKFLEHCPPVVWSQKTHGDGTLFPLSRQQSEGLITVTINFSLPPWHKTKLLSLLNKIKLMISGLEVKLSPSTSFSLVLLIGIYRSFMIIHWYKCHGTLVINLIISPYCFR